MDDKIIKKEESNKPNEIKEASLPKEAPICHTEDKDFIDNINSFRNHQYY